MPIDSRKEETYRMSVVISQMSEASGMVFLENTGISPLKILVSLR